MPATHDPQPAALTGLADREPVASGEYCVALLTGGDDKTYAIGLTCALASLGVRLDYIGSDLVDGPELHGNPLVSFLNLRGCQREDASFFSKVCRLALYYFRLFNYAVVAKPRLFHILWNNKYEFVDRVILMLWYKALGRKVVFTAHNVNACKRNGTDNWFNRFTLGIQYRLADHIFVHTHKMKDELLVDFRVPESGISVIPFGINQVYPSTQLTPNEAKQRLGVHPEERAMLFFGRIAPYKGLEYLVSALSELARTGDRYRLMIAGKVEKGCDEYWQRVRHVIATSGVIDLMIEHVRFIPDDEVEVYFKAADVLVIPYTSIFQSGVPFLGYNYGLPVVATDVGSLREDIISGKTGFVCKPRNPSDLAETLRTYFHSDLYRQLATRRNEIHNMAVESHSWGKAAGITRQVYKTLLCKRSCGGESSVDNGC